MIKEKKYAKRIYRIRQDYNTRLNKIRLGMNEYVNHMPEELYKKIIKNFNVEKASAYPEVNQAYDALSKYLNQPRDRILLTSGADMAIKVVFETFCKEKDIIATCSPTFAMYKIHAELLNCKLIETMSDENGDFSAEQLFSLVKNKVRLIVIANPSGVTGFSFDKNTIEKLLIKAEKKNIVVLLDETYGSFDNIDMSEFIEKYQNLVIVRSFSKNIGMAGIRIGYILSSEYLTIMMEKFKPMMEINSFAVESVKEICNNPKYLEKSCSVIRESRNYLKEQLEKLGYSVIEKKGNFVLVDFKKDRNEIEKKLSKNSIEYKILNSPLEKYIRFTVGTSDVMKKLVKILKEN